MGKKKINLNITSQNIKPKKLMAATTPIIEFGPNDIPERMMHSFTKDIRDKISKLCDEHNFPIISITRHKRPDIMAWRDKQDVTLDKINKLRGQTLEKFSQEPDMNNLRVSFSLDALFKVTIDGINQNRPNETTHEWNVGMLTNEAVGLFNDIARCKTSKDLRKLVKGHPIFPTRDE